MQSIRKRRGLTQTELAKASGVSVSLIRQLEQELRADTRVETARRLAMALRVPTTALLHRAGDSDESDPQTTDEWQPVRDALFSPARADHQPAESPTQDGVLAALRDMRPALAANHYSQVRDLLPAVLRDAEALNGDGRKARTRALNLAGWLFVQTRQFDTAAAALELATDAADSRLDAAAAANTLCWSLLRQGKLADARDLATRWADDIEPRFSRATVAELSVWGRLLLGITNAAVRDNRPGEAEDALLLAGSAAARIGREVVSDASTTRTFGPVTVAMIEAESAAICEQPDRVLSIAERVPVDVLHSASASRCRHRLDVANALTQTRRHAEAVTVIEELRRDAPEWLAQQRYARDILARIIAKRRTLTPQMRDLADFCHVPY
jgi:transcriptional regulator with XRE-family HTH domain